MNFNPFIAAMFAANAVSMPNSRYEAPRARKCLLKDCKEMTEHNGGFCCAEHHKKFFDLCKKHVAK